MQARLFILAPLVSGVLGALVPERAGAPFGSPSNLSLLGLVRHMAEAERNRIDGRVGQ